ncbi:FecCD family ABC transporter permease [Raoultella ornithinolytica]|uniref:FecCD family ABC transporter permease n=1 Tax=Raoultella ornithinolytica TaxID=54291 RepID=UPI0015DCB537|nr:iron ABC transporter permease [Raoultella ornithinolytica]BBQ88914.1 peptide ABC transporter substrate-binding protein [Raoultella ornithinolytica]
MKLSTLSLILLLAALLTISGALLTGPWNLTVGRLFELLFTPHSASLPPQATIVFWQIRLPRIIAALAIGASLSAAGAAYQGMFRNPLVSPDILGVAAGAGLGACLAIWLGLSIFYIQLLAFCGGLLVVLSAGILARAITRHDPALTLVLVGIALGTLCGAGISLIKTLADPYTQLPSITFWLLGGLADITLRDLAFAAPLMIIGCQPLWLLRWRLNLLTLSDDEARSLGIDVARLRLIVVVCATLATASAVAIAGIIGWIGLIVPHTGRLLTGSNHQRLLPVAMGIGAILLLFTDTLARGLSATEIPLGILTSFVGAPFFLALLLRGNRP